MAPNSLPNPPVPNSPVLTSEEKNWGMLCHLSALAGFIGLPYGNVLGPLIVWLIKKNDSPFIDAQGKESLNFHLSMAIYLTIAVISLFVLVGFVLLPIVYIFGLIYTIIGAVAASNGQNYRYPLTIRFLS
ncbi:DUF4870 domain-containing protein [bacterium]|nr:MAG: DUF4870 domain-containing protein [bacterium]